MIKEGVELRISSTVCSLRTEEAGRCGSGAHLKWIGKKWMEMENWKLAAEQQEDNQPEEGCIYRLPLMLLYRRGG